MNPRILLLLLILLPQASAYARKEGLFITALEGPVVFGSEGKTPTAAALGKVMKKGYALRLEAGSKARLLAGERVSLGLLGPAVLRVGKVRNIRTRTGVRLWQLELDLKQGCLWLDSRAQFKRPLDFQLNLPSGPLKVASQCRWLVQVLPDGNERLAMLGPDGELLQALRQDPQSLAAVTPTPAPTPVTTPVKGLEAGEVIQPQPCEELLKWARQSVPILILSDDYDVSRKHRPRSQTLGPALVGAFQALSGVTLVDQSASTTLARRAAPALKGMDSLARRVGRELGARWVLVANASVGDVKQKVRVGKHKRRTLLTVRGQAEAKILDVVTGDLLATDAVNTRLAVGKMGRDEAASQSFKIVSSRLAGYLAEHLRLLTLGEPHATGLLSLTLNNVDPDDARQVEKGLSSLDSVQRIFRRKFHKKLLKMDVLLRAPQEKFERELQGLKFEGITLEPEKDSVSKGLEFTVREDTP